MTLPGYF